MLEPVITFPVVKLSSAYIVVRFDIFSNILPISVTLPVLKFDTSSVSSELQELNIRVILVTLLVLKLLRSKDVKELHCANIDDISLTFAVLNTLRSKDLSLEHL